MPAGLLARQVGEFVGRRREQRRWPVELVGPGVAGLVLHGIGGVGKTTLAAELARRIVERKPDRLVVLASGVTVGGALSVDQVLGALADAVRRRLRDLAAQHYVFVSNSIASARSAATMRCSGTALPH